MTIKTRIEKLEKKIKSKQESVFIYLREREDNWLAAERRALKEYGFKEEWPQQVCLIGHLEIEKGL